MKVTTAKLEVGMTASTNACVTVVDGRKVYGSSITIESIEKIPGHNKAVYLINGSQAFSGNLKWEVAS